MSSGDSDQLATSWWAGRRGLDSQTPGDPLCEAIEVLEEAIPLADAGQTVVSDTSLEQLRVAVADEIQRVNGPGGLLAYVEDRRPDLAFRVDRLRKKQARLQKDVQELRAAVAGGPENFRAIRKWAEHLLRELKTRRQLESELLFLACLTEEGGGD